MPNGGGLQEVPLHVSLSNRVLDVSGKRRIRIQVEAEYEIGTQRHVAHRTQRVTLFGRGTSRWDDVARAAAFVTNADPEVTRLAGT